MATLDIFCRIIDNYGDIAICWRLAKQFSQEYQWDVRIWLDDIENNHATIVDVTQCNVSVHNISIVAWKDIENTVPSEFIISAFSCDIPESYLLKIRDSLWVNLEYLTFETWADDFHLCPSFDQRTGATRFFYFPGMRKKSGGLLREQILYEQTSSLMSRDDFWQKLIAKNLPPKTLTISLFCYIQTAIEKLLRELTKSPQQVYCFIPQQKITAYIDDICLNQNYHKEKNPISEFPIFRKGALTIYSLPFLNQEHYDQLLRHCDINFVRGEDSFVRAIWAKKPFIWHIYPQKDQVHLVKLHAFIKCYLALSSSNLVFMKEWRKITMAWNRNQWHNWHSFSNLLPQLQKIMEIISDEMIKHPDLTQQLINYFYQWKEK